MVNHRGPEFAALQNGIIERLKTFYKTDNDVLIVTAAGTGGLESAIVSFLSPGDKVLAVTIGTFGDRFAKIATTYGADVTKLAFELGKAAEPAKVREALGAGGPWKAVLMTQNETSTAVTNPIEAAREGRQRSRARRPDPRRRDLRPGRRPVRDGCVGPGRRRQRLAEGLDGRPGLSASSPSRRVPGKPPRRPRCPSSTSIWLAHKTSAEAGQTPWTPAVAVMFQLDVALQLMEQETLAEIWKRHAAVGAAVRAGLHDPRLQAPGRPGVRLGHGHRRLDPRGPRLEGFQRQAPQATASSSPAGRAPSRARSSGSGTSATSPSRTS